MVYFFSLWCSSILVNFQVSFNLKVILDVAKITQNTVTALLQAGRPCWGKRFPVFMASGFVLGTKKKWPKIIGHFRITFSLFLKASLGAHLSNENEISFTSKFNSFSYVWLCTRPRFEREALGNSEMV